MRSTAWTLSLCTTSRTWRVTIFSFNSCFKATQQLPVQMPVIGTNPATQHSVAYHSKGAESLTVMFPTENGFQWPPSSLQGWGEQECCGNNYWKSFLYFVFHLIAGLDDKSILILGINQYDFFRADTDFFSSALADDRYADTDFWEPIMLLLPHLHNKNDTMMITNVIKCL